MVRFIARQMLGSSEDNTMYIACIHIELILQYALWIGSLT